MSTSNVLSHTDPTTWTEDHVRCWAEWAVKEFNLSSVDVNKFAGVNGQLLCSFGPYQFTERAYIKEHGNRMNEFLERIKAVAPHRKSHEFEHSVLLQILDVQYSII